MTATTEGPRITGRTLIAYVHCARKAYLEMFTREPGEPPEYVQLMENQRLRTQVGYVDALRQNGFTIDRFSAGALRQGNEFIADAELSTETLGAEVALLRKVTGRSQLGDHRYEPIIFAAAHAIRPDDKIQALFTGHLLAQIQGAIPLFATVVLLDGSAKRVRVPEGGKLVLSLVRALDNWVATPPEPPPVLLVSGVVKARRFEGRRAVS